MDYVSSGLRGGGGVVKVEEQSAVVYAGGAGSAAACWDDGVYVEVDLDDEEAFEAECARIERILVERGILRPGDGAGFDPDCLDDFDEPEETMEEFYRKFEESRADLLAGLVRSHEESMREFRRESLEELRRMLVDGRI